jgi:predicted GNAT family acetyltransferase
VGSHQPVDAVTEIVGVGTLPAARRRGLGALVTARLVQDARERGIETVFVSAGSEVIARVYRRLGFERVGTACIAEPA